MRTVLENPWRILGVGQLLHELKFSNEGHDAVTNLLA
jgi:hypothetical protein